MTSLAPTDYVMASPVEYDEHYLAERSVRAFLVDYYDDLNTLSGTSRECWNAFYSKNHSVKYKLVRPSGESTDSEGLVNQYTSSEVSLVNSSLVSIDSITFLTGWKSAIVTFTADHTLSWFGTETILQLVVSGVLEIEDGEIKLVHEHQSNGIPTRITSASKVDQPKPRRNSHHDSIQEPSSPTQSITSWSTSPERQVPSTAKKAKSPVTLQRLQKKATTDRMGDSLSKLLRTQYGKTRIEPSTSMEWRSLERSDWMNASAPTWTESWSGEDFTTPLNASKVRAVNSRRRSFQHDLTPRRPAWREDELLETPPLPVYMKRATSEEMLIKPRRRKGLAVSREVLNCVSKKSQSNPGLSSLTSSPNSNQPPSSQQNATWGHPSHIRSVRACTMVALTSTRKTLSSAAKQKLFQDMMMTPVVRRASILGP